MFDQEIPRTSPIPRTGALQLSLFELFFITTLFAIGLGVYIYISPILAMLAGGLWIVVATMSTFRPSNILFGGLLGFLVASLVTILMACLVGSDGSTIAFAMILFPAVGYFCGAFAAVTQDDSI